MSCKCTDQQHVFKPTFLMGLWKLHSYKTFSPSTQLSMIFILLINVKMPTIVDILTFTCISRINATYEYLKQHFNFFEQLKYAQLC